MGAIDKFYQGSFSSTGLPISIDLGFVPTWVRLTNTTNALNNFANESIIISAEWNSTLPNGSAVIDAVGATAGSIVKSYSATGGISVGSSAAIEYGTPIAGTAIANDAGATVTVASTTGLPSSFVVWISKATGMSQLQGLVTTAKVASATTLTLGVNQITQTAGAAGTTVTLVPITNYQAQFSLFSSQITALVNNGNGALTVYTAAPPKVSVGTFVTFNINPMFGVTAAQALNPALEPINTWSGFEVTAIGTNSVQLSVPQAYTSLNIAFAYPSDAKVQALVGKTLQIPQMIPAGVVATTLNAAQQYIAGTQLILGTSVVAGSGSVFSVQASNTPMS